MPKRCSRCREEKSLECFGVDQSRKDGLNVWCKECKRVASAAYYARNRQKHSAACARWAANNPEKVAESRLRFEERNPNFRQIWAAENADAARESARRSARKARLSPKYRLDDAMSCGIRGSIVRGAKGRQRWERLVGYSVDELVVHLESKFSPGMSWQNYGRGGWHVDHVVPKSVFNYELPTDIDFKRCWALSNLRPLWESDNCSKGATLKEPFQPSLLLAANDNDHLDHLNGRIDGLMKPTASRARSQ